MRPLRALMRRGCQFFLFVTLAFAGDLLAAVPGCDKLIGYRDNVLIKDYDHVTSEYVTKQREKYRRQYEAFRDVLNDLNREDYLAGLKQREVYDFLLTGTKATLDTVLAFSPASLYEQVAASPSNAKAIVDLYKVYDDRKFLVDLAKTKDENEVMKTTVLYAAGQLHVVAGAVAGLYGVGEDILAYGKRADDRKETIRLVKDVRKLVEAENRVLEKAYASVAKSAGDVNALKNMIDQLCNVKPAPVKATGKSGTFYRQPLAAQLAVDNAANKAAKACGKIHRSELMLVSHRCVANKKGDQFKCEVTLECRPALRSCKKMYCGTDKQIARAVAGG